MLLVYHIFMDISKMKRIFNILFLLAIIFSFQSVQAKDIEFIQVSDLHFKENQESIENFKDLIGLINSSKNLNFVVFTGDNIDKPNRIALNTFLKLAKKIKVPYYIQIGNHDCLKSAGLDKNAYLKLVKKYSSHNGNSFNFTIQDGDFTYIFIDGMKQVIPSPNGYFKKDDLAWLDEQLEKNSKKNVIIFQHFPLIDFAQNSSSNLYKAQNYKDILSKHNNVKAIFAGHYHTTMEVIDNGVYHFVTPPAKNDVRAIRNVMLIEKDKHNYEIITSVVRF